MRPDTAELEKIIGYRFKDKELLLRALTHSSYANEDRGAWRGDNERLEFLGDAVLDMVVSNIIFKLGSDKPEGFMTKLRAAVVCERSLAKISRQYGFNSFLFLGKGEEQSGGRERDSVIADGVEALIGAVYLDSGYSAASVMVERFFSSSIAEAEAGKLARDSKTELQELLQAEGFRHIEYVELGESGPDHDKSFSFELIADGQRLSSGTGKSKKKLRQRQPKLP